MCECFFSNNSLSTNSSGIEVGVENSLCPVLLPVGKYYLFALIPCIRNKSNFFCNNSQGNPVDVSSAGTSAGTGTSVVTSAGTSAGTLAGTSLPASSQVCSLWFVCI
jgi:hypothetical protein